MKTEKAVKLYNSITNMKDEIIEEAQTVKLKRKNPTWVKWGAVAACLAVVSVIMYGVLSGNLFRADSYVVTLDNGDTIKFVKTNEISNGQFDTDYDETTRDLTEKETDKLFSGMSVSGFGYFLKSENKLVGLEGKIGGVNLIISSSDRRQNMLDTIIDGNEESTKVNGVDVNAGYFLTDSNSKGVKTYICYAAFELGNYSLYVENSGQENKREKVSNELSKNVQDLINNGEFDLSQIHFSQNQE